MAKNSHALRVPREFYDWVDDLADKEAYQSGNSKSKTRVMRLLATQYKDKIEFRGRKIDIRLF